MSLQNQLKAPCKADACVRTTALVQQKPPFKLLVLQEGMMRLHA